MDNYIIPLALHDVITTLPLLHFYVLFIRLSSPTPAPFFCVKRKGEETAIQRVFPLNWQQVRKANLWGFRPTDTRYVLATLNKRRQPVFVQHALQ